MDQDFEDFIADPRLRKTLERLKRSNDIFDIIEPNENQHSDILKWLFDPREGHGQGDAILKDFLTAAYENAQENILCNKDFFAHWTPSRIARTGFNSLISLREYVLPTKNRLDLLMVDPVNEILIVVENKHGAKLGPDQLETYYQGVASIRARAAFSSYKTAHIVLDRNYGGEKQEEQSRKPPRNRWAFLDYQWLESGADRAELQLKRGNESAGLVISYCQKQTDYVPPEQKELDDILADIAMDYRPVVNSLRELLMTDVLELTKKKFNSDVGEKWIFSQQYPELVKRLASKARLSFIENRLKKNLPSHNFSIDYGKRHFWLFDNAWEPLNDENSSFWPVCVCAWEKRDSLEGSNDFCVGIQYRPHYLSDDYKVVVQAALEKEFIELQKGRQNAAFRMLGKMTSISESNLAMKAQNIYARLEKALAPIVSEIG